MSFAITPKSKGDEEKVATAIRRLAEEDQTLRLRRDQQTGEEILSGMSQMHVEVALERAEAPFRRRHRAPSAARPVPRDDPPRGARPRPLQEADGRPRPVRRLPHRDRADAGGRVRVRRQDRRRRHPAGLPTGGEQGHPGGDAPRRARRRTGAGRPRGARRRLVPHRRLVGDGVQDRRLDGVEGRVHGRRPRPARADHGARGERPRRRRSAR